MENTSKEINNIITVDQVDYDVTEFAFNLLKAPYMSVKDILLTNNIRLPRRLRMEAMKVALRPLIVKTRNECLTLDQQLNYRLLWFNKFSEGQMAFYFGHFKDKELNQLFGQKLYKNILLTLANSSDNEEYKNCLQELVALSKKYEENDYKDIKIKDFIPAFDPIFYDPKNYLDGLPVNEFRPICYNSATKDQLMNIGEKYNVEVPKKINKDTIFDYVVAKLKAMKVDTTYLIENEKNLKVKDIREFAFQQGLDTAGELTKKEVIEYILQRSLTTKDNYECPRTNQVYEMNIPISDEEAVYDKLMVERIRIQEEIKRETDALRRLQGEELAKAKEALEVKTREQLETEKELERVKTELENKFEEESLKSMEDLDTTLDDYNFDGPVGYDNSTAEDTNSYDSQLDGQNYYGAENASEDLSDNNNDEKEGETLFNNQNPNEEPEVIDIDDMDFGDFSEELKNDKPNAKKGKKQANDQFASPGTGNSLMIYQSANELMVIQKATKKKAKLGSIYAMIALFIFALIAIGAMIGILQQSRKLKTVSYTKFREELSLDKDGAIKETISEKDKDKALNGPITATLECKPRSLVTEQPFDAFSRFKQKAKDPKTGKSIQIPFDYRIHKYSSSANPGLTYFKDNTRVDENKIDFKQAFINRNNAECEKYVIEIYSVPKKLRAYIDLSISFNNIVEIVDFNDNSYFLTRDEIERVDKDKLTKYLADQVIKQRKELDPESKIDAKGLQDLREWYADLNRIDRVMPDSIKGKNKLYASKKRTLGYNISIKFDNPTNPSAPVIVSFGENDDSNAIAALNGALKKINEVISTSQSNYTVGGWKMTTFDGSESKDVLKTADATFDSESLEILKKRFPNDEKKQVTIELVAKFNREFVVLEFYREDGTVFEANPFDANGEWPIKTPLKNFVVDDFIAKFENPALREKEEFKKDGEYLSHWEVKFGSKSHTFKEIKEQNLDFETIIGTDNLKEVDKVIVRPIYRNNLQVTIGFDYGYASAELSGLEQFLKQPYRDDIKLYHDTTIEEFINKLVSDTEFIDGLTMELGSWGKPYANDETNNTKVKLSDFRKPAGKTYLSELESGELKFAPEFKPITLVLNKEVLEGDNTSVRTIERSERLWVKKTAGKIDLKTIEELYKDNPEELKGLYIATPESQLVITQDEKNNSNTIELKLYRVEIEANIPFENSWTKEKFIDYVYGQKVTIQVPELSNFIFKGFTKKEVKGTVSSDQEYLFETSSGQILLDKENLDKAKSNGLTNLNNVDKLRFVANPAIDGFIKTLRLNAYYERRKEGSLTFIKNYTSALDNISSDGNVEQVQYNNLPLGTKFVINFKSLNKFTISFSTVDNFFPNDKALNDTNNLFKGELFTILDSNKKQTFNNKVFSVNGEVDYEKIVELNSDSATETLNILYNRKEVKVDIKPDNPAFEPLMEYDQPSHQLVMWVGARFKNNVNNWKVLESKVSETHEFKYYTFTRGGVADKNADGTELKLLHSDLNKDNMIAEIKPYTTFQNHVLVANFGNRSAKIYPFLVYTNEENNEFEASFTSIRLPGSTNSKYIEACTIDNRQVIIDAEVGHDKNVDLKAIEVEKGITKSVDIPVGFEIVDKADGGWGSEYNVEGSQLGSSSVKVHLYFKVKRQNVKLTIIDKDNNELSAFKDLYAGVFLTSELIKEPLEEVENKKNNFAKLQGLTDTYSIDTKSLYTKNNDSYVSHNLTDVQLINIKGQGADLTSEIYCSFTVDEVTMTLYIIESDHNNDIPFEYRDKLNTSTNALNNPKEKLEGDKVIEAVFQVRANEQILDIYQRFIDKKYNRDGFGQEVDATGQPVQKAIKIGVKNSENAFFYLLKRNRYTVKLFDSQTQVQINSDITCYHGLSLISALGGIDPNNGGKLNGKEIKGFINKKNNSKFNENDPILSDLELLVQF